MLHVPNQHGCHEKGARMHLRSRYLINSMLEYKMRFKVEKIIKDSLDSIPSPSPSVKIQIIGGKSVLTRPSNVFSLHFKQTFPSII